MEKNGTILGKFENGESVVSIGVLYRGWRNAKVGFYKEKWEGVEKEKWEGVESEDNKDMVEYGGEINNGVPNGQGTQLFPDGSKYVGEVWDGKMWNGIRYDKDGNILGKIVNGEQQ